MFGILSEEGIEKLLKDQLVARIGCHANDITYVLPLSYAYDGTYIYGRTFDGLKVQMIRENPKICVQVDDIQNLANWRSVIAWGVFEELTDHTQKKEALKVLTSRSLPIEHSETMELSAHWPFTSESEMDEIKGIVFRIHLLRKTGRFEQHASLNGFTYK